MSEATITMDVLNKACAPGGASVLTSVTELAPGAYPHAGIALARFVAARGSEGTYAYETRFVGGEPVTVVLIDSKGSALNRVEAAISSAVADSDPVLARTPRVRVSYEGLAPVFDFDLPHRVFDGHIRAGTVDGHPATTNPTYRAARDASPGNAKALLETSPLSLVLGSWDSTRRSHQGRYRSALVGEIIGVLADQTPGGTQPPNRGAARFDMLAASVRLGGDDMEALVAAQEDELSTKNVDSIRKEISKAKKGTISAAALGLGAIPPSVTGLGFVSCSRIIRSHVLSFAALRQLRFGLGLEGDVACRALLAALALNGLARSDAELFIRANCDLVEAGPTVVALDERHGNKMRLEPLSIQDADALLRAAIDAAVSAEVRWEGQILDVVGNPLVAGGIESDSDED
jgi:CRISPR-associated protein Csb1